MYTDGLIYDELSAKLEKQQMYIENLDYELADKVNKKKIKIPKIFLRYYLLMKRLTIL